MSLAALSLDIKSTKRLFTRFSPNRATMLRGRHGIGKSQVVYQIAGEYRSDFYKEHGNCERVSAAFAKESGVRKMIESFWKKNGSDTKYDGYDRNLWHYDMGVPVIERRLSQMTEGDITGIPFEGNRGGTVFRAVEWLLGTCEFPSVLFLDELNRAIKGVEQATFQLADSKAFDGNLLHAETRVMVAVNIGDQYDVTPMDPAAISRYAVVDLDPTLEDWVAWAGDNCHPALAEFIRSNPRYLEFKDTCEPNKKYPDRRAWGNLDGELAYAGLYKECNDVLFCHMAASMVGFEAANAYWNFFKERAADISAEDVLADWSSVLKRLPKDEAKRHQKFIEIMGKMDHHLKTHEMTPDEAAQYGKYMNDAPAEVLMGAWKSINVNKKNLFMTHPHIEHLIVRVLASTNAGTPAPTPPAPAPAPVPAKAVKPRTRK